MTTTNLIWRAINTVLLVVILIIGIMILIKVNNCCNFNESKTSRNEVFVLRTAEAYDSVHNLSGTHVWIDLLPAGQEENGSITIWNNCPEKVALNVPVIVKKSSTLKKTAKIETKRIVKSIVKEEKPVEEVKEEQVKKDSCDNFNLLFKNSIFGNADNRILEVNLTKQFRDDSPITLDYTKMPVNLFSKTNVSLMSNHTYIEYLPNPYRCKAEESFASGIIFGGISVSTYVISEILGHPKYWDNRDNSDAEKKSSQILALRIISGVSAVASVFEFSRTVHFHKMESKYIISPTKIGLTINLNPDK
jgi:hypothetical protein